MPPFPSFVGGSYTAPSIIANAEMLMNLFVARNDSPGARFKTYLRSRWGSDSWASVTENPCRGWYRTPGDRVFAVMGAILYEFTEVNGVGVPVARGIVGYADTPATFAALHDQLAVTSNNNLYILTLSTNTLTLESTTATVCDVLDTFFLALDVPTSTFFISASGDGTTWDPSQFIQPESGDSWVAMKVVHREIRLVGKRTADTLVNTGASPFPFEPVQSAFIKQGTGAPWSVGSVGDQLVYLSQNEEGGGVVVRSNGYSAERISAPEVEAQIQRYSDTSDAVAWSHQIDGHLFYVLNFPTANATWAWNQTTGYWHQEGFWNPTARDFEARHEQFHVYAFGKHLVGDRLTGAISSLSSTTATERDGSMIRRVRRTPTMAADNYQVTCSLFEAFFEPGVGTISGQGEDPVFMLRQSQNGGKTWGAERWKKAGKGGDYDRRAQWFMNGAGRQRVWELVMTDPIPWNVMGANLELGVGTS